MEQSSRQQRKTLRDYEVELTESVTVRDGLTKITYNADAAKEYADQMLPFQSGNRFGKLLSRALYKTKGLRHGPEDQFAAVSTLYEYIPPYDEITDI